MSRLRAADLTTLRPADPLWRPRISGPARQNPTNLPSELAASLGLPPLGFASPLGFWFAAEESWTSPPPYLLERIAPNRLKAMSRAETKIPRVTAEDPCRRAVVVDRRPGDSAPPKRRMDLAVDGRSARVEVDEAAWPEAGQAALLAAATYWRLEAIDRAFDRLADHARDILADGRLWRPWRHRPDLSDAEIRRDGRALILDLSEFEGPLTDPTRFTPCREAARLYQRLCARLDLHPWRDRIDERAEVIEGILDTLSSRRDHRQVILLEILIVTLLAADIAISQFLAWE